ncbi:MAG TPA: hypothetical protein VK280_28585 [Streptosporangiaceae bacterium]|nr:hypothetical protein [Streptosporangiaceae bacterium]
MNDKTGGNRGLRRAGALAVAAAVAMLAAGCGVVHISLGGGSASSSASAPTYAQVLALAQCMRSNGVPDFPDPSASGGYTLTSNGSIEGAGGTSIDINSSRAQAAYGDCRHVLPGAPSISRLEQLEQLEQQEQQRQERALPMLLKYSQCMRSHGVPDFPDFGQSNPSPAPGNGGAINPSSPQFQAASTACQHLLPPGAHLSIHAGASAS